MAKRITKSASAAAASSLAEPISTREYQARRNDVLRRLSDGGGSVGLVLAGDAAEVRHGHWVPDLFFYYLTGITSEPGAAVLFDPTHEDETRRISLFLRPLNPEADRWDSFRDTISLGLRDRLGFGNIMRLGHLPDMVSAAARRAHKLACLHPFGNYHAPVSADLALFRKVQERVVGVSIEDRTDLLRQMRSRKSPAELALMRRAIAITAKGFEAARAVIRPGGSEMEIAHALEATYRAHGASGPSGGATAYNTIAGAGARSTLLHYNGNDQPTASGDLLLIDSGAQYAGYAADITRTYPVSGKFTTQQRDMYEIVLEAQFASIAAAKPKARMTDVLNASREVFAKRGVLDHFWHGIGHHLGLAVHDADPATELQPGHVITIEPGLYLPSEQIGIRIEDDILITAGGNENLSAMIPKRVADIAR